MRRLIYAFGIFLVASLQFVSSTIEWQEPYFANLAMDGVHWQTASNTSAVHMQKVNVREEIAVPFTLAKINYFGDSGTPTLGAFDIGDNNLLGARINLTDNEWYIIIEKRQDYENPLQRIYFFQIYIKDPAEQIILERSIFFTLENIFDNSPSLTYRPSPCKVEELKSDYLTNCIFSIYDPDGMERNVIRIESTAISMEQSYFAFQEYGATTTYNKQYKLKILKELHYDEKAIYNIDVKVYDANNNTGNIFAILEVIDLPNRDPVWVRPLTTATFNEKEKQIFDVKAIDGDTGINKPICYRLEFEDDYSQLMRINSSTGSLHIEPIDRDILKQQIFSFYICAYKCDNSSWLIRNSTILIVQDINDHIPEITLMPKTVQILEGKFLTLPLEHFYVEDIDLGVNASYKVFFENSNQTIAYSEAFSLVPNIGYQKTEFSLTVTQADKLDYEDVNWRSFQLRISAEEIDYTKHKSDISVNVELINWNDEWPIFQNDTYEVVIYENVTKDTSLLQIQATDRDVDDDIIHSIVGNFQGIVIDPISGLIKLSESNVFDYERQSLVMLQVQAKDTLATSYSQTLHTSYTQLVIKVLDVNDETPELRMPRFIVNVTENSTPSTLITSKIEARDSDTTANLEFDILWSLSYGTKGGQEIDKSLFLDCFVIESELVTNNLVYGHLKISEKFQGHIDYEKYDTIFLMVGVTDINQEINEDFSTAVITIRIDDLNDNVPQFRQGTLEELRSVIEMADEMSTIGNYTPPDVIDINATTGLLRVVGQVQCDVPKLFNLEYEVTINDSLHINKGRINISIIDTNNQVPIIDDFEEQVSIYENALTGQIVGHIRAYDNDRDSPHNILEYTINSAFADLHNLFEINVTTGQIRIHLRNGFYLDRDMGVTFYYIPIDIRDNFNYISSSNGPVNQRSTYLNVTLLDVNDNAPVMPDPRQLTIEFSEADAENTLAKVDFTAMDIDERGTPNSHITYTILSMKPAFGNNPLLSKYDGLFTITSINQNIGNLKTRKSLQGFYGLWNLEIEASDQGMPKLKNSSQYEVFIKPFNYHVPELIYPKREKSIRICYSLQEPKRPLYVADCRTRLKQFQVYDPDGGEYGDIKFELTSDVGHDQYFELLKESRNSSSFYVKNIVPAGIYLINLRAIDGGGSISAQLKNLKIVFVDMLGDPMFQQNIFHTNFTENQDGLHEQRFIPEAYDPKNEGLDDSEELFKLYYFIDASVHSNQSELFELNSVSRQLKLKAPLDREAQELFIIYVKVSNNEQGATANPNSVNYTLEVHININDVNDNPPKFSQNVYAAGITSKDLKGKIVLELKADDPDFEDRIKFNVVLDSYESHGKDLLKNYAEILSLNIETGALTLNSYVSNEMQGYLKFDVEAMDVANHKDVASVKIYIVSESNRVKFVFLSDVSAIRKYENFLRTQFQELYGYDICNIDSIDDVTKSRSPVNRQSNISIAFITEVIVHFIHNNEAIDAYDIQKRSSDLAFISRLQNALQLYNLILNDIPHVESIRESSFVEGWLTIVLVAVNALLGLISIILIVLYIVKVGALKRQLKAFEPAEFGSVASNLNRMAVTTSNMFSVEGSNPIFNKQSKVVTQQGSLFDTHESSTDSDEYDDELDGLHDDPLFEMNNMKTLEDKTASNFDHNLLNNNFFSKEKICNKNLNIIKDKERF